MSDFLCKTGRRPEISDPDPLNIGSAFVELTTHMMQNPTKLVEAQMDLWQQYYMLWHNTTMRMLGRNRNLSPSRKGDRRFRDEAWENNELLISSNNPICCPRNGCRMLSMMLTGWMKTAQKVEFYTRQFADAISPTNFMMTNPEVLRATIESGGENLLKGLSNLLDDLERGKGKLQIKMTDLDAFKIGENVATTEGSVIGRTQLMELLQYKPATDKVAKRPLMIVPPWINKYYILDLRPENSFIKWAVDQGHTVLSCRGSTRTANLPKKALKITGVTVCLRHST